jgi:hypothetical protein
MRMVFGSAEWIAATKAESGGQFFSGDSRFRSEFHRFKEETSKFSAQKPENFLHAGEMRKSASTSGSEILLFEVSRWLLGQTSLSA